MNKNKGNKSLKTLKILILFFIIVFVFLQIILSSIKNLNGNEDEKISESQVQLEIKQKQQENMKEAEKSVVVDKLGKMKERDRIEYYFSLFLNAVETKNYEVAYGMLYYEFKQNYFPDLESFEKYAQKTFPRFAAIKHTNFERLGETYVLFINISNSLASKEDTGKEMKIIIKENAVNDFVMSFSVI